MIETFSQGTSSSSAMIIGSAVLAPCPISEFGAISETAPAGLMRINAFGAKSPEPAETSSAEAGDLPKVRYVPTKSPPPATALIFKKWRRFSSGVGKEVLITNNEQSRKRPEE